jgi:hypothetical protein
VIADGSPVEVKAASGVETVEDAFLELVRGSAA